VATIAAVIAIGLGVFTGLGSTAEWRRQSNDASLDRLSFHDLRVELTAGSFVLAGRLDAAIADSGIATTAVTERLVLPTQLDASTDSSIILVAARIIGGPFGGPGTVDDLWLRSGRLTDPDADVPEVVVEDKFARHHGLASSGAMAIAGGVAVQRIGTGTGPEEFFVSTDEQSVFAEADFATLYTDLITAQRLTGRIGEVNDAAIRLAEGADALEAAARLSEALDGAGITGATIATRDDAPTWRVLYEDIENDQLLWNLLSGLVLGAAALASFNLVSRFVEAQRREIGIGMALGVPRHSLTRRPLLLGVQIGVLGTVAGIGVGIVIGRMMRSAFEGIVPLPVFLTPFQPSTFALGAALGLVLPVLAAGGAMWRAVRVEPVVAIRTGHLAPSSGRIATWANRVPLPGRAITQLPLRNLLRSPRRTALTAIGIGAALTALVAVLGLLDAFGASIERGAREVDRTASERVTVRLTSFEPVGSPTVTAVVSSPTVGTADLELAYPATVSAAEPSTPSLELTITVLPFDSATWTPSITDSTEAGPTAGLVLTEKAARDLGVVPGDAVRVRQPTLGPEGMSMTTIELPVAATNPLPIRTFAWIDASWADDLGLSGLVNSIDVIPAEGVTVGEVQRAMFGLGGVASARPVLELEEMFDDALDKFTGFLTITAGAVTLLALLIAVNSTRIALDERRRENATMLAFGLPTRTVLWSSAREAMAVGVLATGIGLAAGVAAEAWMLRSFTTTSLPEFDVQPTLAASTVLATVAAGILATGVSPFLLARRVTGMDLPDTLRVME